MPLQKRDAKLRNFQTSDNEFHDFWNHEDKGVVLLKDMPNKKNGALRQVDVITRKNARRN